MNNTGALAPVAIFVYNRLENTKKVIEALQKNYLAKETDVFIYSDAPKTAKDEKTVGDVRQYLKTVSGFKTINIIERKENFYIEKNIIEGVTELVNKYEKIIVMEDDGVAARNFLNYINDALDYYENKEKIMHIAGFTFISMPEDYKKTILWRYSENTGGGWATWKNRWDKFKYFSSEDEALSVLSEDDKNRIEMDGLYKVLYLLKMKPIPWDICWYIAISRNNSLAVNPPKNLVKNIGLYNGVHFNMLNRLLGKHPFAVDLCENQEIVFEDNLVENKEALGLLLEFYNHMSKRKRARMINAVIKILSKTKITKLIKKIIS